MTKASNKLLWGAACFVGVLVLSLHWRISTNAEATIQAVNAVDKSVSGVKSSTEANAQRIVDLRTDLRQLANQVAEHDRGPK